MDTYAKNNFVLQFTQLYQVDSRSYLLDFSSLHEDDNTQEVSTTMTVGEESSKSEWESQAADSMSVGSSCG